MLTKRELKLLEKVTQIDAIRELNELAKFVKKNLKIRVHSVTDNLGSIFGVKKARKKGAAHYGRWAFR